MTSKPQLKNTYTEAEMKAALEACAQEPIHIPGSIQPHGFMLILDETSSKIKAASENAAKLLGTTTEKLLGTAIEDIIGPSNTDRLKRSVSGEPLQPLQFIRIELNEKLWDANAHRSGKFVIFELEPVASDDPTLEEGFLYDQLRGFSLELQKSESIQSLYDSVTQHIRDITGFDRVKLYKFDDSWNGEVVAESKVKDVPTYMGLRFPASDIPPQARELYSKSYLRIIADIRYEPSKIVGLPEVEAQLPVDMTYSVLRSVSPVHIQYLENMGVGASMSISIIQDGKLWGLVACHHMTPKYIPYRIRMITELMGHVFSSLLTSFNEIESKDEEESRNILIEQLSSALSLEDGLSPERLEDKLSLAKRALKASGMAFMIEGELKTLGTTPKEETLMGLILHLRQNYAISLLQTDDAGELFADDPKLNSLSGGILAVPISHKSDDFVIWFRKAVIEDVSWAGATEKTIEATTAGYRLAPRSSFELYKETVQKKSVPWRSVDVQTALTVIRLILEYEKSAAKLQSEYKTEFLANMSHELRTPMNAIVGIANILDKDGTLTDKQKDLIRTLNLSSEGLLTLINDLLDLSKIEKLKVELEAVPFNLAEIVETARSVINVRAKEKNLQLNISYPAKEQMNFFGDPTKVRQVLLNLLSNAVKFTEKGFVNVLVQVNDSAKPNEKNVSIEVTDTGIGMSPKQLEHIFEKFTQADKSTARKYGGTGLGLAISKEFAKLMQGDIKVTSLEGMGSQFTFEVPLATSGAAAKTESASKSLQVKANDNATPNKRVLLAEDYEGNIVVAIFFLQEMNIDTYVVNNGKEAVEAMQKQKFDAVFMDVQMPVMDGIEATKEIRKLQDAGDLYPCPIIGMTANAFIKDKERCLKAGMNAYLSKPFSNDDLKGVVEEYLA